MIFSTKSRMALQFCGATAIAVTLNLVATDTQALELTGTSGAWSNIVGAPGTYTTVGNEAQVRWGIPVTDAGQSGLGFEGVGASTIVPGTEFLLGTLRHFNNTIQIPTANAVDLAINLDLEGLGTQTFDFTMLIDETTNNLDPCPYGDTQPCADSITWANAFAPQTFSQGGINYTLELLGFGAGGTTTQFISDEARTNSAELYARITEVPNPNVPTPATVLPILMGMFSAATRQKDQEQVE